MKGFLTLFAIIAFFSACFAADACMISPSSVSVAVGGTQQLEVSCSSAGELVDCPQIDWTSTIGSITPNPDPTVSTVVFSSGPEPGTGVITAEPQDPAGNIYSCAVPVEVIETAGTGAAIDCELSPPSLTIGTNQQETFEASCSDASGEVVDCPAMSWSSTIGSITPNPDPTVSSALFSSGSEPGTGSVTAQGETISGNLVSCSSPVEVTSQPLQNYSMHCELSPSSLTIAINQQHTFEATCFDSAGEVSECPEMDWSSTIGTITPDPTANSAIFSSGSEPGTGVITAQGNDVSGEVFSCSSSVIVMSEPQTSTMSCSLDPKSLTIEVNQQHTFEATCLDSSGEEVECPEMEWSTSIGTITPDPTVSSALFSSGPDTGTGVIIAQGNDPEGEAFSCSAPVTVTSSGGGGGGGGSGGDGTSSGGGSNSGGASFASSSTLSFTCAGQPGTIAITIFEAGATVLAEVYYTDITPSEKVLSEEATSNQELSFTPDKAGDYELRATVGTDQQTAPFSVPACTPATLNVTKNITIELAEILPQEELEAEPVQEVPEVQEEEEKQEPIVVAEQEDQGLPWYLYVVAFLIVVIIAYFIASSRKKEE